MWAVIETGGKQYRVEPGQKIKIEKISGEVGQEFLFEKVLLVDNQGEIKIGQPYLSNVKVKAKILNQGKGKKVIVFRYHPKTRYRKKKGHRQLYTEVEIQEILIN